MLINPKTEDVLINPNLKSSPPEKVINLKRIDA